MSSSRAQDAQFMALALSEAARATGRTSPNPMVGCVIVKAGRIVGIGHHRRAGLPHAEVEALRRAGKKAHGADVYVTLEPCDHHGRTPPCTEALLRAGVQRVVVAMRDPNPIVDGRGLRRLRAAGVEVEVGIAGSAAQKLNAPFVTFVKEKRPYVTLKLAQSLDGRVATREGNSRWITSEAARRAGHALRGTHDAILVGVGTVLADDPRLDCRLRGGRDPIRIVLDTHARTPPHAAVIRLASTSKAPTWIVVGPHAKGRDQQALRGAGAEVIVAPQLGRHIDLERLMSLLAQRQVLSLLVEGGPTIAGAFADARLIDAVQAFIAPKIIGGVAARSSVEGEGVATLLEALDLGSVEWSVVGGDLAVAAAVVDKRRALGAAPSGEEAPRQKRGRKPRPKVAR